MAVKSVKNGLLFWCLFICCNYNIVNASSLLTSYLPASMQALAYYIDMLQYEPLATTTVEPPFRPIDNAQNELTSTQSSAPWTTSRTTTTRATTTRRPTVPSSSGGGGGGGGWWKPPEWWQQTISTTKKPTTTAITTTRPRTTTKRPSAAPTPPHKPGLYAPAHSPRFRKFNKKREGIEHFEEIGNNPEGFDALPLTLIRDIQTETEHDEFTNDVEALDNFLRLYDDNYGRAAFDSEGAMDHRWSASTSTAGNKRVPPTKPYVDFLLVYDLLKRDAKAENLSKYEGYSDELLQDLYALSYVSAERQLYTLFKRMLDRRDIQRSDVVSRIQSIQKDLANPDSITVKSLRYIPALVFLP